MSSGICPIGNLPQGELDNKFITIHNMKLDNNTYCNVPYLDIDSCAHACDVQKGCTGLVYEDSIDTDFLNCIKNKSCCTLKSGNNSISNDPTNAISMIKGDDDSIKFNYINGKCQYDPAGTLTYDECMKKKSDSGSDSGSGFNLKTFLIIIIFILVVLLIYLLISLSKSPPDPPSTPGSKNI